MPESPTQNLILASGSPRRRELLLANGYEFTVIVPDDSVEASVPANLPPEEFVAVASQAKANAVVEISDSGLVLAADTVAVCDSKIIGKPIDRDDAGRILRLLAGRKHSVLTGVTLWNVETHVKLTHVESTDLVMKSIEEIDLEGYLDTGQWAGKAGAFGYQDGLDWVRIKQGLESNVVGLPVELLPKWLQAVGI